MLYCWAMCLNVNDWWLAIFFVSLRCSVSVTIGFVPFLESAMPRRFQTKVFGMLEERMLLCVSLRRLSHPLSHTHAHAIAAAPTLSLFARALCGRHMRVYLGEHKARYHLQLQTNWRLWSGCIGFFGFGFFLFFVVAAFSWRCNRCIITEPDTYLLIMMITAFFEKPTVFFILLSPMYSS